MARNPTQKTGTEVSARVFLSYNSSSLYNIVECNKFHVFFIFSRYKVEDLSAVNFRRPCQHKEKSKFKCMSVTIQDVVKMRKSLNKIEGKVGQEQFLVRYMGPIQTQRNRPTTSAKAKKRQFSCSYFALHEKKMICVCKKFFQATFAIKSRRLNSLAKTILAGAVPAEKRGGDRRSHKYVAKKEEVLKFLKSLPAEESHYNRNKSKRCYLSSELSICKLRKLYNASVEPSLQVKRTFFEKIFNKLNIGISSPASDICSKCFSLKQKILSESDMAAKQRYIAEKRVHTLKAKAFYELLKEKGAKTSTLCFDLQQVQPLPRTPIGESFYLRQIGLYSMCVTEYNTKEPTFYNWSEDQAGRGSVTIGSALLHHLENYHFGDSTTLRLFCDGCGGQNKNQHIVHVLMFWLLRKAPASLKEVKLYFPVRGHSFLPCDRVFGRVEKDLRKYPFLPNKEMYFEIYRKHGDLKLLGNDWALSDIKSFSEFLRPIKGIQNLKRIYFKRSENGRQCVLKIFENLRFESEEKYMSYLKRGKTFPRTLRSIPLGNKISQEKKADVAVLLEKQFGENWREKDELNYFKRVLDETESVCEADQHSAEKVCDCLEEPVALRI